MDVPAVEQARGGREAGLLVPARADAAVLELRGGGLAEVVAQRAQHDGERTRAIEVRDERRRLVHGLERVRPHVAFGVPFGVLGSVGQRKQLRADHRELAPVPQQLEPDGRMRRLQQQLLDLAEDALGRQLAERHRRAQRRRGRVHGQLEARGQLDRAQGAQRVLAEACDGSTARRSRCSRSARPPCGSTIRPVEGLEQDRVDREVAPAGGLLDRQAGIARDRDAAMSRARPSSRGAAARRRRRPPRRRAR